MRFRIVTLRFSETLGGFDDHALQELARDKEILDLREHFFVVHEVPHLTCIVTWASPTAPSADGTEEGGSSRADAPRERASGGTSRRRTDPLVELDEKQRILFQTLREWRASTAREEGVPAYLLFTNRELVEIVRRRPDSPTALGHVPGIGPGKVRRYGRQVLARLGAPAPESARTDRADGGGAP